MNHLSDRLTGARRCSSLLAIASSLLLFSSLQACGSEKRDETARSGPEAASKNSEGTPESAEVPDPASIPTAAFDLAAIPLSSAALPEFPYLDWPESVLAEDRTVARDAGLDAYLVIAGEQLLPIEGRLEQRSFSVPAGHSQLELRRGYEDRIASFGGVRVDRLRPTTDSASISRTVRTLFAEGEDPAKRLDLQRYDEGSYEYGVFVVRTAAKTIWFVLQSSQYSMVVTTIEAAAPSA